MKDLTTGQRQVLEAIKDYWSVHGVPPTIRDLMAMTGHKSTNSIRGYIDRLKKAGAIEVERNSARGVRLKEGHCPTCGRDW